MVDLTWRVKSDPKSLSVESRKLMRIISINCFDLNLVLIIKFDKVKLNNFLQNIKLNKTNGLRAAKLNF
jgi:hypothetical protein